MASLASPFILSFSPFPTFRHPTISSKTGLDGRVTWRSGKCHSRTPSSWHMQKASKICHKLYKPSLRFPNSPHAAAKTIVKSCLNSFQQLKSRCRFLFSSLLPFSISLQVSVTLRLLPWPPMPWRMPWPLPCWIALNGHAANGTTGHPKLVPRTAAAAYNETKWPITKCWKSICLKGFWKAYRGIQ